jgi:hypothetical protein
MADSGKPLADKLGVKPGQLAAVVGTVDPLLAGAVRERGGLIVDDGRRPVDHLFVEVETPDDLASLAGLVPRMRRDGSLWTVRRKGRADQAEGDVLAAGRAAGLVDVKVVRLSETHSLFKWVIPVGRR